MNLLRRIASLPGVRRVLLHPAVRRRVAALLALRFAVAARRTTTPMRLLLNEYFRHRGRTDTYVIRATGVPVVMQHGRDLEALFELFERGEYEPPARGRPAARRLARAADRRRRGQRRHVLRVGNGSLARSRHHRFEPARDSVPIYRQWAQRPRRRHVHRGRRGDRRRDDALRRRLRWRLPRRAGARASRCPRRRLPLPARRRLRQDRHRGRRVADPCRPAAGRPRRPGARHGVPPLPGAVRCPPWTPRAGCWRGRASPSATSPPTTGATARCGHGRAPEPPSADNGSPAGRRLPRVLG